MWARRAGHGDVGPQAGTLLDGGENRLVAWQQHLLVTLLQEQRHGRVVDVLRGETEMDELLVGFQPQGVETAFDEILDSFDIVVCGFLYLFHLKGILLGEMAVDVSQLLGHAGLTLKQCGHRKLREVSQGYEIFDFDPDTVADKRSFGEIGCELIHLVTVAPVDGRNGIKAVHIVLQIVFVLITWSLSTWLLRNLCFSKSLMTFLSCEASIRAWA